MLIPGKLYLFCDPERILGLPVPTGPSIVVTTRDWAMFWDEAGAPEHSAFSYKPDSGGYFIYLGPFKDVYNSFLDPGGKVVYTHRSNSDFFKEVSG